MAKTFQDTDGGGGGGETTQSGDEETQQDDSGGLTQQERERISANVAEDVASVREQQQGVETAGGEVSEQAREFEQEIVSENEDLRARDVRITREGDMLQAEFTQTGRTRARGRQRAAAIRKQREFQRQIGGAVEAVVADREQDVELAKRERVQQNQEVASAFRRGSFGRREGVNISAFDQETQREINEDLVQQFSRQKTQQELERRRPEQEQFGDTTLFRVEGVSPEEAAEATSRSVRSAFRGAAETIAPRDRPVNIATTQGSFQAPGTGIVASGARGAVQGVGDIAAAPFDAFVAGKELGEFGAAGTEATLEGQGGEFLDRTEAEAVRRGTLIKQSIEADPANFASRVGASAVAAGGAIGGASRLGGARAARATSVAIQPGEELAISAARRGVISSSTATKVPGVRAGHIGDSIDSSGPSLITRTRQTARGIREDAPAVSARFDPDAPVLEIDPDLKREIRSRTRPSPPSVPSRPEVDIRGRAGDVRQQISEVGTRARGMVPSRGGGDFPQQIFTPDADVSKRVVGSTDPEPMLGRVEGAAKGAALDAQIRAFAAVKSARGAVPSRPSRPSISNPLGDIGFDSSISPGISGPGFGGVRESLQQARRRGRRLVRGREFPQEIFTPDAELHKRAAGRAESDPEPLLGRLEGAAKGAALDTEATIKNTIDAAKPSRPSISNPFEGIGEGGLLPEVNTPALGRGPSKSPVIIPPDADLQKAAAAKKFTSQGRPRLRDLTISIGEPRPGIEIDADSILRGEAEPAIDPPGEPMGDPSAAGGGTVAGGPGRVELAGGEGGQQTVMKQRTRPPEEATPETMRLRARATEATLGPELDIGGPELSLDAGAGLETGFGSLSTEATTPSFRTDIGQGIGPESTARADTRLDNRTEPITEPGTENRLEFRVDTRTEPVAETQPETRTEPKGEPPDPPRRELRVPFDRDDDDSDRRRRDRFDVSEEQIEFDIPTVGDLLGFGGGGR